MWTDVARFGGRMWAPRWTAGLVAVVCAASLSCKGKRAPLGPSDAPPAGLDTSQAQMKDGAGNPGPARVRLQNVRPPLGAQLTDDPNVRCDAQVPPFACFDILAEFCMDAVSNPGNSALLNGMQISVVWSPDGVNPISRGGFVIDFIQGMSSSPKSVAPGACVTVQTQPGEHPPLPRPSEGVPRYLMLVASYGIGPGPLNITQAACPTPQTLANTPNLTRPPCAFRVVHDLGYHF